MRRFPANVRRLLTMAALVAGLVLVPTAGQASHFCMVGEVDVTYSAPGGDPAAEVHVCVVRHVEIVP